jgi:hypothetical protein
MNYQDIPEHIVRYVKKATYNTLNVGEKKAYLKGIKHVLKKINSTDELAEKFSTSSITPLEVEIFFVGMKYYGDHKFDPHDEVKLEKEDDNKSDPNAIKVLVKKDGKWEHVAYVARGDALELRKHKKFAKKPLIYVAKYISSYKYRVSF